MTREDIDKILLGKGQEALDAHIGIINMQKDPTSLLKTGHAPLDKMLVGGLNNKMVFIGSRPSMGKTHHCQSTINNLLDEGINPNIRVKLLRLNLEMPTQALLLRELKASLGRSMSDIISKPFSEGERGIVQKVVGKFRDKRVVNFSASLEGDLLKYLLDSFISIVDEEDKDGVTTKKIVLVDHLHIYSDKTSIDAVLKICNEYKMKDPNLSFIFYFQFNRTTEDLWRETKDKKVNPRNMLPNAGHIYLTDLLMQYADIVMGMVIPQVVDLEEFVSVHKERNEHLKDHFIEEDNEDNIFIRLKGRNRIYYNFIKIRMVDSFDDPRLFCDVLDPEYEKIAEKLYKDSKKSNNIVSYDIPSFSITKAAPDMTRVPNIDAPPTPKPNFNMDDAFGPIETNNSSENDDRAPF